jgi:hypothetical protein
MYLCVYITLKLTGPNKHIIIIYVIEAFLTVLNSQFYHYLFRNLVYVGQSMNGIIISAHISLSFNLFLVLRVDEKDNVQPTNQ